MNVKTIKCVVVGDGAAGKTCMLQAFQGKTFPDEYISTVFENSSVDIQVDDTMISLNLIDIAGQEGFDRLRQLAYPLTDIILACFSVVSPASLKNVEYKWVKDVKFNCSKAPYILVGLKTDLRDSPSHIDELRKYNLQPISTAMGQEVADRIKAEAYVECSALNGTGLSEVFNTAIRIVLNKRKVTTTPTAFCNFL